MLITTLLVWMVSSKDGWYSGLEAAKSPIARVDLKLKRPEGKPELGVRVTYPKTPGKAPVLVWSHGMYGSQNGNLPLVEVWAKAGYVVIQPTHGDSATLMSPEARRELLRNPNTNNTGSWNERPLDIRLVLDQFSEIEAKVPELKGRLDAQRIGMGGHSFGAWTTQVVAGCKLGGGLGTSLSDPRPLAFVALSGQGPSPLMPAEGFAELKRPVLWATGDLDTSPRGETPAWRKQAYELAAPGDKFLVWIKDATHGFGGINGRDFGLLTRAGVTNDKNEEHVKIIQSTTLAFWDTYVKADPAARKYLTEKQIEKIAGVTLSLK